MDFMIWVRMSGNGLYSRAITGIRRQWVVHGYGQRQMMADYETTKPEGMAVVYIGFRCISE